MTANSQLLKTARARIAACMLAACLLPGPAIAAASDDAKVEALRARAKAGDADASFRYGTLRYYGLGVTQDWNDAVIWLVRAADQGQAGAQCELGMIHQIGSDGVVQNFAQAATFYRDAAEQGDNEARLALAGLLSAGQGVEKDDAAAAELLRQASLTRNELDVPGGALPRLYKHFLDVATAIVPLPDDQQIP